ncbi:hypothetical protein [Tropicibacter naphthalenivorans]|uniref:Aminoglycoside phosphotransferase n=1 Tax=Tropicibacter naphthalenivorans TaxID=441103 RepID=A0A0N7LZ84_9RHOB|nr:hypothetical protein [Tropicibacter naphthalenivorans]CUH76953.1 Aminoglycoside phosphotransferase [Tropicibacter naphthalenivorans]SMC62020.1 hypothetical protein SAMN04488093_102404 [Tropicibacter naphthalenivorans]
MLSLAEARGRAQEALAARGVAPELTALRPDAGRAQAHLFGAALPEGRAILKVFSPAAAEREGRQAKRGREVAAALATGSYRAPAQVFHDTERQVLAMQAVDGFDLSALWAARADEELATRAGAWLRAFHGLSRREVLFDPTGQVNWLARLVEAGATGAREIVDLEGFTKAARLVQAQAVSVQGRLSVRAVTHRDMTLSNLLMDQAGAIWGIDFENRREDEPLRDVYTLALDLMTVGPHDGRKAVLALVEGYSEPHIEPPVRVFLQRCFSLWVWANTPEAPSARQLRRLEVAEQWLRARHPVI